MKLAKLVRTDFMSHVENVDDAWHNPKHLGSFKIFMNEMASFLDEAVLPAFHRRLHNRKINPRKANIYRVSP